MADAPLSRRDLLRGLGTAAVAASCVRDTKPVDEPDPKHGASSTLERATTKVSFVLDGKATDVEVEPRTTLLAALRIDLAATATKEVCDRGSCGACMVLVDGVPHNSCMMLAHDAEGHEVTTVAGLGGSKNLSVLQQKFVQYDASQCGFCTSGMVISAEGLLRRAGKKAVSPAQVADAISGNTCRCGTYPHVVAAVVAASKELAKG